MPTDPAQTAATGTWVMTVYVDGEKRQERRFTDGATAELIPADLGGEHYVVTVGRADDE